MVEEEHFRGQAGYFWLRVDKERLELGWLVLPLTRQRAAMEEEDYRQRAVLDTTVVVVQIKGLITFSSRLMEFFLKLLTFSSLLFSTEF